MKEHEKPSNPDLHKGQVNLLQDRVTLRDHFAGQYLQGHLSSEYYAGMNDSEENLIAIAKTAYKFADAMLKQREL